MRKTLIIILTVLSLLLVTACTNDIKAPDDSWENVFLQYWNAMNTEYVHFGTDTDLNWDAVYDEYLPKFQALDYTNVNDSLTAFTYFKEISINVDDYHYFFKVADGFGNMIMISPAAENKWWAQEQKDNPDTERTIMSYPDVKWNDSTYGITVMMSVDRKTVISAADPSGIYEFMYAIEGMNEVSSLKKNEKFHSSDTFQVEKSYSFNIKQPEANAGAAEMAAYSVVNALGLKDFSYDYGVTSGNIFYFYFSSFVSTKLEPLLYEKTLTDEQKEKLKSEGLLQLHGIIWCIPEETDTLPSGQTYHYDLENYETKDADGKDITINFIEKLKNVTDLFSILESIGKEDKCTIDNKEYSIEGVIMDVRSNGGGAVITLESILGNFFKDSEVFAKVRYKDGYSRLEFTPWVDFKFEDGICNGVKDYDKPFAIITNGYSVSCSELSSSIVKNLMKKGAVIGGQTYGGTCGLTDRNIYHSGPFSSNSLTIYTTTYETELKVRNEDGSYSYENLEGKGITPTVSVKAEVDSSYSYSSDTRFDAAVKWVNDNKNK